MQHQTAYCKVSIAPVRAEAKDSAEMVTQLLFGEVVEVLEESEKWFKIRTFQDNYEGYIDPKQIRRLTKKEVSRWMDGLSYMSSTLQTLITPWGKQTIVKGSFLPHNCTESFSIGNDEYILVGNPSFFTTFSPVEIAEEYINAPYLWGGKSPFGIDCSGLTQMSFRFMEINLPRDASQQVEYGIEVEFEDRLPGDLMFFSNKDGKIIHVGVVKSSDEIIHASGQVRIDKYDKLGILHYSNEYHTHTYAALKRMI